MNKIYKIIWSKARNCYVVVSEMAKRNGKCSSSLNKKIIATFLAAGTVMSVAWSQPAFATATGTDSKDIGIGNTVAGDYSIAVGKENTVKGNYLTAIGESNTVANDIGDSLGRNKYSVASVAIGDNNTIGGNYLVAIGSGNTVAHDLRQIQYSFAFGQYVTVSEWWSAAWGYGTTVEHGVYGTAWGNGTTAGNDAATAWGFDTSATGQGSTAWGSWTRAAKGESTAFGTRTQAINDNATAFGWNSVASGAQSTAFGNETVAAGINSTAFGLKSKAAGDNSLAVGNASEAYGKNSLAALGGKTGSGTVSVTKQSPKIASADVTVEINEDGDAAGAVAIGEGAVALKKYTYALGQKAAANAIDSLAFGNGATVASSASNGIAIGSNTSVAETASGGVALGSGSVSDRGITETVYGWDASSTASNGAHVAVTEGDNKDKTGVWAPTASEVAVGHIDSEDDTKSVTRRITGVAAGSEETDAVNVAQLKTTVNSSKIGLTVNQNGIKKPNLILTQSTVNGQPSYDISMPGKIELGDEYSINDGYETVSYNYKDSGTGPWQTGYVLSHLVLDGHTGNIYNTTSDVNTKIPTGMGGRPNNIALGVFSSAGFELEKDGDGNYVKDITNNVQKWKISNTGFSHGGAVALGFGTAAAGTYAIAAGRYSIASGNHSFAQGSESIAEGENSIALGDEVKATGDNSAAFGSGTTASASYAMAFGRNTTAEGSYATAFGSSTTASKSGATAFGYNNSAKGYYATSFGEFSTASGEDATAFGYVGRATGDRSTAFGTWTIASGKNATAWGSSSYAAGELSTAFGDGSAAYGDNSLAALGGRTGVGTVTDQGWNQTDNLTKITKNAEGAVAVGEGAVAQESFNIAVGLDAEATGENSIAIGSGHKTKTVTEKYTFVEYTGDRQGEYSYTANGQTIEVKDFYDEETGDWTYQYLDGTPVDSALAGEIGAAYNEAYSLSTYDDELEAYVYKATNTTITRKDGAKARAKNAIALGTGAMVTVDDGVALGSGSVASRGVENAVNGYDVTVGDSGGPHVTENGDVRGVWAPTHSEIAVGYIDSSDPSKNVTRRITGVAAGAEATDAVNVAQLKKATAGAGMNYYSVNSEAGVKPPATGDNYDNLGATKPGSLAAGYYASATGKEATAFGFGSISDNESSSSLGSLSKANAKFATAVGHSAQALGEDSTATGSGSLAQGTRSVAAGYSAQAVGDNSTAYGVESTAAGKNSTAVGLKSEAFGQGTIAIGHEATAGALVEITQEGSGTDIYYSTKVKKAKDEAGNEYIFRNLQTDATVNENPENGEENAENQSSVKPAGRMLMAAPKLLKSDGLLQADANDAAGDESEGKNDKVANVVAYNTVTKKYHIVTLDENGKFIIGKETEVDEKNLNMGGIAMGSYAHAEGYRSMSIGRASGAYGEDSTAMGIYANAMGDGDMAIGHGASTGVTVTVNKTGKEGTAERADGFWTTTLKTDTETKNPIANKNNGGIAIGSYAHTEGTRALAVGRVAGAYGTNSTAIGLRSNAYGEGSIAFGHGVEAGLESQKYTTQVPELHNNPDMTYDLDGADGIVKPSNVIGAVAMGSYAKATGRGSLSVGRYSQAASAYSTTLGIRAKVLESAENAIAIGREATVGALTEGRTYGGLNSIAIGTLTNIKGQNSIAIGMADMLNDKGTEIVGVDKRKPTSVTGDKSIAIGLNDTVKGNSSIAIGTGHTVKGNGSGAIGDPSTVEGDGSYAIGNNNEIKGVNDGFVLGNNAKVTKKGGVALGSNSVASVAEGDVGYDPATGKASAKSDKTWKSTAAAVSVGGGNVTRQITNVAAGTNDTDAVNVAQLKALQVEMGKVVDTNTQYELSGEAGQKGEDGSTAYTISLKDKDGNEASTATVVDTDTNTTNKSLEVTGDTKKTVTLTDSDGNEVKTTFTDKDTRNTIKAGDDSVNIESETNQDGSLTYTITAKAKGSANVEVKAKEGSNITVGSEETNGKKTYTVDVKTDGKVEENDTGIMTGGAVYSEVRVQKDGNYIKKDNTAAQNITALDEKVQDNATNIENLGNQINNAGNRISQLDSRVKKVGAGAAALAALHAEEFDPDDKLSFAAGVGNYRGETAAAIGMFYRPTDRVMFSMGSTVGNGENMVNAGISFALDRGFGKSSSRAAMSKEITELRNHIAKQDEQMAKQDEQMAKQDARIAELEALVSQLAKEKKQ